MKKRWILKPSCPGCQSVAGEDVVSEGWMETREHCPCGTTTLYRAKHQPFDGITLVSIGEGPVREIELSRYLPKE